MAYNAFCFQVFILCLSVFKLGACQPVVGAPGFLELFLCGRLCVYMYLRVCVCPWPEAIIASGVM